MMYAIKAQSYDNGDVLVTLSNGDVISTTKDQVEILGIAEDNNKVLGEEFTINSIHYLTKEVQVMNELAAM